MRDLPAVRSPYLRRFSASVENCCAASCVTLSMVILRLELFGVEEDRLEGLQALRVEQVIEGEGNCPRGEVGVIRADDDVVDIRNDQQRRVLQRIAITQ